jgi:hypothetical protein
MAEVTKEAWLILGDIPVKVKIVGIRYHDLRYAERIDEYYDAPMTQIGNVFADYESCRAAIVAEKEREIARAQSAIASIPVSEQQ